MEAIIASSVLLGVIIYLFNVPPTQGKDPMQQYIKSLMDSYTDTIKTLSVKDPYSLILLIDSAMPRGYNERVAINYYRKYDFYTGTDGAPVEKYILLPSEGMVASPNSELKSNWYRSVFKIINNGNSPLTGETAISVSLYKQDVDNNGIPDPIDLKSIRVFTDDGELDAQVSHYEDYYDRMVVGLTVNVNLNPGETKNLYVYYIQGDDYE